jgi:hypothetical protein
MTAVPQVYVRRDRNGPRVVARTTGVPFAREEEAVRWAVRFGPRPPGVRCPAAVFAKPLDPSTVVVGQAADLGDGDDPPLAFRFLFVPREAYPGDPFALAERFPPNWAASGDVPAVEWEPAWPTRDAEEIRELLKTGDGPLLLGTTQAVLDGTRVAVARPGPDPGYVRGVWRLLPHRSLAEHSVASFAFANDLGFDLVVLPAVPAGGLPGWLTEEQARDYPEGRYELAVQVAVESGDAAELERLFARRSSRDVLRTALIAVALAAAVVVLLRFL